MHLRTLVSFVFLAVLWTSCSSSRSIRPRTQAQSELKHKNIQHKNSKINATSKSIKVPLTTDEKVQNYLRIYGPIAQDEMKKFKIPASITLAQGLLESGFGEGRLAVEANNHFGIKCHKEWDGKRIYHDDDEKGECFRVYKDPALSYRDHSLFLTQRSRYAFLFGYGKKDFKAWAKGLKKAGYATDPKYPEKLIRLIERFNLDYFDDRTKETRSSYLAYVVKKGDTLYSIARKLNIKINELKELNRLKDNTIHLGQELVLPKK